MLAKNRTGWSSPWKIPQVVGMKSLINTYFSKGTIFLKNTNGNTVIFPLLQSKQCLLTFLETKHFILGCYTERFTALFSPVLELIFHNVWLLSDFHPALFSSVRVDLQYIIGNVFQTSRPVRETTVCTMHPNYNSHEAPQPHGQVLLDVKLNVQQNALIHFSKCKCLNQSKSKHSVQSLTF